VAAVSLEVDGDVVIVTGAAGGLGSAYARLLARHGARVVVNDTGGVVDGRDGDQEAAARVAAAIVAEGGEAIADARDSSTVDGARAVVGAAVEAWGRVDGVIANAGILRDRTFLKLTDEDLLAVLESHLLGTARIFHAAFPVMRERGYGRLVATTSASGLFGNFGQANYAAAKMGIVGLSRVLALEGERFRITANVVAPVARTRMTEGLLGRLDGHAAPEQVAPLVGYLVSRACAVTGRIYSVGAGRVARVDIGVTKGLVSEAMDVDWVVGNIEAVDAEEGYVFPTSAADEAELLP
jgi:NAD(P)-dependent dehydrogenase (short-subunit alcohol dehydrogenase family)